jgi:hypothetical protein
MVDESVSETNRVLYSGGGYVTLSFVPTFGTMLLGLLAGRIMQKCS